jgi:transposase-like protein
MEIFTPPNVVPKRPPGRMPRHSPEYRMMVAKKVVEEGMSYREASKAFDLSHGSISAIVKQYKHEGSKSKRNERTSKYKQEVEAYRHQTQMKDLKLEIADLYLENLMLKKALEHSLRKKKENSSVITSENLDRLKEDAK